MTKSADDEAAAIRAVLTALGQVIGTRAMAALIAEVDRARDSQPGVPRLAATIVRPDANSGNMLALPAEVAPIVSWLLCHDRLSVGIVAAILHDFGIIAPNGHGMIGVHPAMSMAWNQAQSQLAPDPLPGITLVGFEFGPTAQDDLRFSGHQRARHAAALHERMGD